MLWLIALWAIPVAAFLWARRYARGWLWRITGLAFGAVVSPASTGLYSLYYVGPLAALLGLVGLPLALIHQGPGYDLAIWLGLLHPRTTVEGSQHFYIALLNGAVWSLAYGTLGWVIDWLRGRTRGHAVVGAA